MGINRLNWGQVTEGRPPWAPALGRLFAIWPSPVDHDVCFQAAGVEDMDDMDDTDPAWDMAFEDMIDRLLGRLSRLGPPSLAEGEYPHIGRNVSHSLGDALEAAAINDNFPACSVSFGVPARASVRTSHGHAILWVWLESGPPIESVLSEAAGAIPTREARLKWSKLW